MSRPNLNYGYSGLEDNDCLLFERNLFIQALLRSIVLPSLIWLFIFCTCSVLACRGNVHVQQLSAGLLDTVWHCDKKQKAPTLSKFAWAILQNTADTRKHTAYWALCFPLLPNLTLCPTTRIFAKGRETKAVSEGGANTWLGRGGVATTLRALWRHQGEGLFLHNNSRTDFSYFCGVDWQATNWKVRALLSSLPHPFLFLFVSLRYDVILTSPNTIAVVKLKLSR